MLEWQGIRGFKKNQSFGHCEGGSSVYKLKLCITNIKDISSFIIMFLYTKVP